MTFKKFRPPLFDASKWFAPPLGKMPKHWTYSSFLIVQKECANLFYPPWYMYTWISIWKIKYLWSKLQCLFIQRKIMLFFVHCAIIISTYQCIVKVPNLLGTPHPDYTNKTGHPYWSKAFIKKMQNLHYLLGLVSSVLGDLTALTTLAIHLNHPQ